MAKVSKGVQMEPETWALIDQIRLKKKRDLTETTRMLVEERLSLFPLWDLGDEKVREEIQFWLGLPSETRERLVKLVQRKASK